jgi:hypothetical protein
MRPSDQAPGAAPSMRKDSSSMNGYGRTRHAIRRRGDMGEPGPGNDRDTIRRAQARSVEGEVHFFLQRTAGGLYVEREEVPRRGTRTLQSLVFDDWRSFEQWCGDDPIRFRLPLLHAQLRRDGEALWRVSG